jgi:hypothetical protein
MSNVFKALPLPVVRKWLPLMEDRDVSVVARGPEGFVEAYEQARGTLSRLPPWWRDKRRGFIARHMAQVIQNDEPLYGKDGLPTRRYLALIAWAYSPDSKLSLLSSRKK